MNKNNFLFSLTMSFIRLSFVKKNVRIILSQLPDTSRFNSYSIKFQERKFIITLSADKIR